VPSRLCAFVNNYFVEKIRETDRLYRYDMRQGDVSIAFFIRKIGNQNASLL